MFVPGGHEFIDRFLQIVHADKHAAADSLARQLTEPPLNQIQPTGTSRHKVRHKARVTFQPGTDSGMLVGAIVVHHQVQRNSSGKLLVQPFEKLQEFLVPMPLVALPDHTSLQQFQGGEQRRGAVAFVIMRIVPQRPFFIGRPGCVRSKA